MTAELVETIETTIQPNDHPYMKGAWRPTYNEWNAIFANGDAEVMVVGERPKGPACPSCGQYGMRMIEGCMTCPSCGHSKCG